MKRGIAAMVKRVLWIPNSTWGASMLGIVIGLAITALVQPYVYAPAEPTAVPPVRASQLMQSPMSVLKYKGKYLVLTGEPHQIFEAYREKLGPWEGSPITKYDNCPGLGHVGEYIPFPNGVLVFPKEYEPKMMSLTEFQKRRKEPIPYTL